jgi:hypothetical protein
MVTIVAAAATNSSGTTGRWKRTSPKKMKIGRMSPTVARRKNWRRGCRRDVKKPRPSSPSADVDQNQKFAAVSNTARVRGRMNLLVPYDSDASSPS